MTFNPYAFDITVRDVDEEGDPDPTPHSELIIESVLVFGLEHDDDLADWDLAAIRLVRVWAAGILGRLVAEFISYPEVPCGGACCCSISTSQMIDPIEDTGDSVALWIYRPTDRIERIAAKLKANLEKAIAS